jgi:hypothetical protein
MQFLPIILISVSICYANLDSLVKNSTISENKADYSGSFFRHHSFPGKPTILTPPDKLFNRIGKFNKGVESTFPDINNLKDQVTDLKATVDKQSVIIESLQKQSDAHSENLNFTSKMTDSIIGALVTIVVAYITTRRKKQDKS